jgi:hypothetical protein
MKLIALLFVVASWGFAFSNAFNLGFPKTRLDDAAFDVVAGVIREDIASNIGRISGSLAGTNTCTLSADGSSRCPLSGMPRDETTIVLTSASGDGSQCIFGDSYGFQVIPGDSDKLLFYFQGGGACWDKATTAAGLCTTTILPNAPTGVFDRTNKANPFSQYTIVHALYCSGDVWAGNMTASYKYQGNPVTQVGIINAQSTVNWVQAQIAAGSLGDSSNGGRLAEFVGMGCSAGSVGVQLWSDQILSAFPAKQAAIVPDSYAGEFPPGSIGPLMKAFRVCDTVVMPEDLKASCNAGQLDIQELVQEHIAKYPQYPFAFIQSKIDIVQTSFYVAVGLTTPGSSAVITPKRFYEGVNAIFSKYNALPNFVTYLVDGPMHCFTPMNIMYDTTNYGPYGKRDIKDGVKMPLAKWLRSFPLKVGQSVDTECAGDAQPESPSGSLAEELGEAAADLLQEGLQKLLGRERVANFNAGTKYCSDGVQPKTFVQAK